MVDTLPDAVVIVVTHNSASDIEVCIASLAAHVNGLIDNRIEVHVVDNASTDDTRLILSQLAKRYSWMRLHLLDENVGFGAGNNVVLHKVPAQAYVLLNADAWLVSDSLAPALDYLRAHQETGILGLPLVYPDGSPQSFVFLPSAWHRWLLSLLGLRGIASTLLRFAPTRALMSLVPLSRNFAATHAKPPLDLQNAAALADAQTLEIRNAAWVAGAAMILSPEFVEASNGFDAEIFLYGEDEDLCLRAHRLGFEVEALQTTPIVHKLGWGNDAKFRPSVARLKYDSLRVFIAKNIGGGFNRAMMRMLLPLYVYGRHLHHFVRGTR